MKTVLRFLAGLPGIVYVAAFVLAAISGTAYAIYAHGKAVGEARVHMHALRDSVEKAVIVHRLAVQQTDAKRQEARSTKRLADSSRVIRSRLREAAIPYLDALPDPVVRLIAADDQQIARDSVALAAHVAVDTAWVREREFSADLDTLRQHQVALPVAKPHRALWVTVGVVVGSVLTFALAASR